VSEIPAGKLAARMPWPMEIIHLARLSPFASFAKIPNCIG